MNLNLLSKHRNVIYGFAILWIVFFHAASNNAIDFSFGLDWLAPFDFIIRKGNEGVDAFLFLSGVCLYFSFVRNPDISSFMYKRLIRVVPATFIIYGVYWLVRHLIIGQNPLAFLSRMTLMRFWMDGEPEIWFVSLILILYMVYPYLFCCFFGRDGKESHLGRFLVTLGLIYAFVILFSATNHDLYDMLNAAITRVPAFVVGAWMGKFVYESRQIGRGWIAAVIAAVPAYLGIMFLRTAVTMPKLILNGPYTRFFFLFGAIALCFLIALICEVFDKRLDMRKRPIYRFLAWTGTFSLELYLTHMMLGSVMHTLPFYSKGDLPLYLAMVACAFILAWAVKKLLDRIVPKPGKPAVPAEPAKAE